MTTSLADARRLDDEDPLRGFRDRFVPPTDPGLVAYLDGNSLGRPPKATVRRLHSLVTEEWGSRLIRSWSERWMTLPEQIGDRLAAATLGAAPGQVVIADSTSVCLYKLLRGALALRPGRTEIVTDRHNFPTDSYIVQGVAAELGLTVRWIDSDPDAGVTAAELAAQLSENTAVVTLSHIAYRSAWIADLPALTALAHRHGALVVWDLCHSVGCVPLELDSWGVDFAVGCTYKYLNAGPGAPAFGYVRAEHHEDFRQPVWGWMGGDDPFAMRHEYRPASGVRRLLSGTPPITAMIGVDEGVRLVAEAGIERIRAKAVALTETVVALADERLAPHGIRVASPRDPARRGGHVTLAHPEAAALAPRLIDAGVVIDFRPPDGIRVGLSPLTTGFAEVWEAMDVVAQLAGRG
ncbi:kynureninase [Nocardia terpenica]|uniref:kynureninase n=1 Tax=Nocardia terpenica TaxID=455432 RepID=UPI001892F910|nr:kynureninase [Nocardia terpenica]MBF6063699.1 kynureninase [Nocardia terpenica]MBF6107075.1 kynureninase [Nocardia terpenica]MBF6114248.1 kynureninase [Nocardia terpenica]MBF6121665.1 kynureninase [Nocardia terpenica]MBF6154080.1 kynureninase [Nocardia terpenica]